MSQNILQYESKVWLADKMGNSFNTVKEYVQNISLPNLDTLYELGKLLNVNPKKLLIS